MMMSVTTSQFANPNSDSHVIAPQVQVRDGKIVVQDKSLVLNVPAKDPGFVVCVVCVCVRVPF